MEEEQSRVQEGVVYFDMGIQADHLNTEAPEPRLCELAYDCHMAVRLAAPEVDWAYPGFGPEQASRNSADEDLQADLHTSSAIEYLQVDMQPEYMAGILYCSCWIRHFRFEGCIEAAHLRIVEDYMKTDLLAVKLDVDIPHSSNCTTSTEEVVVVADSVVP